MADKPIPDVTRDFHAAMLQAMLACPDICRVKSVLPTGKVADTGDDLDEDAGVLNVIKDAVKGTPNEF